MHVCSFIMSVCMFVCMYVCMYVCRAALAGTRNRSLRIDPTSHRTMSLSLELNLSSWAN